MAPSHVSIAQTFRMCPQPSGGPKEARSRREKSRPHRNACLETETANRESLANPENFAQLPPWLATEQTVVAQHPTMTSS